MASILRRVRRNFVVPVAVEPKRFNRIDDPELALEVAARREKNNLSAVRSGLPAVGSKLVNRYGPDHGSGRYSRWLKVVNRSRTP
jgi:hypothetical protein